MLFNESRKRGHEDPIKNGYAIKSWMMKTRLKPYFVHSGMILYRFKGVFELDKNEI